MKNDFLNLKNEYQKINKKISINHRIVEDNYKQLCMNFFYDKYNTFVTQKLAEETCALAIESEHIYVDWLNKE